MMKLINFFFFDKLIKVVSQIRLLDEEFSNKNIVKKILMSLLEMFELKISSLEDLKDLDKLSFQVLVSPLQA